MEEQDFMLGLVTVIFVFVTVVFVNLFDRSYPRRSGTGCVCECVCVSVMYRDRHV